MSTQDTEKSFWSHLDDLRSVIWRIIIVIAVLGIAAFIAMPHIFDAVILAPCKADFPLYKLLDYINNNSIFSLGLSHTTFHVDLINIQLASQFFVHMSASCWTAAVIAFPIIIYLLWTFISPGLYESEKRGVRKAFFFGNIMFYVGLATGYFLVFPLALRFLADYHLSDAIPNTISLDSYMDNFFTMILMMGIVFELPLVAWLLGKMGFLTKKFFSHFRRHAIVALLILAAFITPTGDPFTLFAVFLPLYALWEFSAFVVPSSTAK